MEVLGEVAVNVTKALALATLLHWLSASLEAKQALFVRPAKGASIFNYFPIAPRL